MDVFCTVVVASNGLCMFSPCLLFYSRTQKERSIARNSRSTNNFDPFWSRKRATGTVLRRNIGKLKINSLRSFPFLHSRHYAALKNRVFQHTVTYHETKRLAFCSPAPYTTSLMTAGGRLQHGISHLPARPTLRDVLITVKCVNVLFSACFSSGFHSI